MYDRRRGEKSKNEEQGQEERREGEKKQNSRGFYVQVSVQRHRSDAQLAGLLKPNMYLNFKP